MRFLVVILKDGKEHLVVRFEKAEAATNFFLLMEGKGHDVRARISKSL